MSTEDEDGPDIDPADLDDLGDLDGDTDADEDEDAPKGKPIPDAAGWAKVQAKLERQERRINGLLGKDRKGKPAADVDRQLANQLRTGKGKPAADDDDEPADDGEAERWRGIAIQNAAAAQIAAAGFSGSAKQAAKLARLMDTENITPNRDGSFDLEDEIEELQEQFPQLFGQVQNGRRAPRVRTADSRKEAPPKDPSLKTSQALLRSAGYR